MVRDRRHVYRDRFSDKRWERLAAQGARSQLPLWASTGTKNPDYSDVLYVEELIGPDVINTMPDKVLRAFADHGQVAQTVDADLETSESVLAQLSGHGLDLDAITSALEREGVASFCDSYHQLLECITEKVAAEASA